STMRYLLIEPKVKAIAPNIALMKWASWSELKGYEYQYVRGKVDDLKITPDVMLMSCIFSYYADEYEKTIDFYLKRFPDSRFIVGGVFPTLNGKWFKRFNGTVEVYKGLSPNIKNLPPKYYVEIISEDQNPYPRNRIVLYSSHGCVNKCGYCAVPRLEGKMRCSKSIQPILSSALKEMPNPESVVLYDNNFTEHRYFDRIVDELADFGLPVDIHGLHVDSFTKHKAKQLSRLKWASQGNGIAYLRFSFDKLKYAEGIEKALKFVVDEDVKAHFFCYMLFNWLDSPDYFWKRIETAQKVVDRVGESIFLFPQRYEPYTALKRHQYVGKHWTNDMVKGVVALVTHLRGFIPLTRSRNVYNWIGHSKTNLWRRLQKWDLTAISV
ncbi:hypothetical protein ACFL36_06915, partial [Thermodesulfobacteriota bacterium]